MRRRLINLLSVVTIVGGGLLLARPAQAAVLAGCTEEQWEAGADAANGVCAGASFTISCSPGLVVVTVVSCPKYGG
jgi:hypothetical protein